MYIMDTRKHGGKSLYGFPSDGQTRAAGFRRAANGPPEPAPDQVGTLREQLTKVGAGGPAVLARRRRRKALEAFVERVARRVALDLLAELLAPAEGERR